MLGAIIGDIVGSRFEFDNHRSKEFDLFAEGCFATDDSIMTLAVAKAILVCEGDWERLGDQAVRHMQAIGRKHPDCGFGGMFHRWIFSDHPRPYNSFGNGAAMRVSPCGFIAKTEEEARSLARKVTEVTHNHEEGVKGAEATAVAIFMARSGATKREIRERIERDYYKLGFTLDGIRDVYAFNETCQETVPQAIVAFLESTTFEDAVRNAISIGGDSDTLAAIACAVAEAYYGVPLPLKRKALTYLDGELRGIFREWEKAAKAGKPNRKFDFITKHLDKLADKVNWRDFCQEFCTFAWSNPKYGLQDYQAILAKHGLNWSEESMKAADADALDEQTALALILGVFRAEHYTDGIFETFVAKGFIERWLARLKAIDDERKPEPDRPALRRVRIGLRPFREGNTSELLLTEHQVTIRSSTLEGGSVAHQYEIGAVSGLGEACLDLMTDCLDADGWHDSPLYQEIDFAINLYELEAEREDGSTIVHRGVFDRAHIPEKQFGMFIETVRVIIQTYGFGGIVGLSGFAFALKKGEVKYCGVEFSDGGKVYHYRTTDLRIDVGDEVIVPVGENNHELKATVETVEFCRWDDTPYPLEKTKEIIRLASDEAGLPPRRALTGVVSDTDDGDADDHG
ncbi:MAG: ADP-ribosylglycohydrolase family protein [Christensenellaceae bacterium]|nr:ADP-ribosylglycohydrolase family protein [Christensenellaceae bacterium]